MQGAGSTVADKGKPRSTLVPKAGELKKNTLADALAPPCLLFPVRSKSLLYFAKKKCFNAKIKES